MRFGLVTGFTAHLQLIITFHSMGLMPILTLESSLQHTNTSNMLHELRTVILPAFASLSDVEYNLYPLGSSTRTRTTYTYLLFPLLLSVHYHENVLLAVCFLAMDISYNI
jgi:hypothetical protein